MTKRNFTDLKDNKTYQIYNCIVHPNETFDVFVENERVRQVLFVEQEGFSQGVLLT